MATSTPARRTVSNPTYSSHPHSDHASTDVNYSHFAGRLGGNQLFILTSQDPQYEQTKERIPDAVAASSWREILDLRAFKERRLWEMATIEGIGVALIVWSSGLVGQALIPYGAILTSGPLAPISLAAVVQFITISLFTFGLGPVTGAHLNPLITMATFVARLSSLARTVLYVVFQCVCSPIANKHPLLEYRLTMRCLGRCCHRSFHSPCCVGETEGGPSSNARLLRRSEIRHGRGSFRPRNNEFTVRALPCIRTRSRPPE